jgi:carbonic anhydrase/acetyltransferase-like protein (isoleucine patch superfamily)
MKKPILLLALSAAFVAGMLFINLPSVARAATAAYDSVLRIEKAGVQLGSAGQAIEDSYSVSATVDLADTLTATCTVGAGVTVTGAAVNDLCLIGPNATAGALQGSWTCFVSATDTVKPVFCNPTVGSINPASGTFTFRVFDP